MTVSALPWWICTKCIYYHHPFLTFVWIYLISFEIKCDPDIELVNLALFTNFVPIGNWSCKCPRFYVRHFDCLIRGQKILRKWGLTSEKLCAFFYYALYISWLNCMESYRDKSRRTKSLRYWPSWRMVWKREVSSSSLDENALSMSE